MDKIMITIEDKKRYLDIMIGKVFKIIPIREENGQVHLNIYMWAILNDLISFNSLCDGELIELVVKLNSIYEGTLTFSEIRKVVFDTIDTIKKINRSYVIEENSIESVTFEINTRLNIQDELNGRA
jgi:hypothetical protein